MYKDSFPKTNSSSLKSICVDDRFGRGVSGAFAVSLRASKRDQLNPPKYFLVDERNLPEQTRREKLIAPKNTKLANPNNALL